jgi:hypothetical protein
MITVVLGRERRRTALLPNMRVGIHDKFDRVTMPPHSCYGRHRMTELGQTNTVGTIPRDYTLPTQIGKLFFATRESRNLF